MLPAPARHDRIPTLARQDPALPLAAACGNPQEQAPCQQRAPVATAGCRAFTTELCSVACPGKFKLDLPPHYDGTVDPAEFLQLYEMSIERRQVRLELARPGDATQLGVKARQPTVVTGALC